MYVIFRREGLLSVCLSHLAGGAVHPYVSLYMSYIGSRERRGTRGRGDVCDRRKCSVCVSHLAGGAVHPYVDMRGSVQDPPARQQPREGRREERGGGGEKRQERRKYERV